MPQQVALTIRARIRPGQAGDLKRLLASMADPAALRESPFGSAPPARLQVYGGTLPAAPSVFENGLLTRA